MEIDHLCKQPPGVYELVDGDEPVLVHAYLDGDYMLSDVVEEFGIGTLEVSGERLSIVAMDEKELRRLKVSADAYSFDCDPEFIEMCIALYEYGLTSVRQKHRFISNFE